MSNTTTGDRRLHDALTAERWARANRELLAKILTELLFEEVLSPRRVPVGDDPAVADFTLDLPDGHELRYRGRLRALGHWRVEPTSLRWWRGGAEGSLPDVDVVVALAAPALGASVATTAGTVVELANTLLSDVVWLAEGRAVADLADASAMELESEMRGHPWIVANKGRLGFDADELLRYAPEAGRSIALQWLALAPGVGDAAQITGLDHATVVRQQVGDEAFALMQAATAAAGLDPATVTYLPVHPWQWANRIVPLHAGDLARRRMVTLGPGQARYRPQQSIRTLVDADHPERRSMKLALSILNTSVYRGLPRVRAMAAPALTEWLLRLTAADPFLAETGLVLLGEEASVSVAHTPLASLTGVAYQHTEMLGAIWRESVEPHLAPGERAVTMAALLHRDPAGRSLAAAWVRRSGLTTAQWVRRLHDVTLPPLLHVLYRFGLAFSPHAQNCLLVLRDDVPVRLVVKDFVDDVMISSVDVPEMADLPPAVRTVMGGGIEPMILVQWIQSGLLVCVHRYLSEVLDDELGYPEHLFWSEAEGSVRAYQERFGPALDDRFALFDVDAPMFVKLCLNRVRLLERGYADAAERPVASASGWIDNPLALEGSPWSG